MKEELLVRNLNAHQLFKLLQEPEFSPWFMRTPATIRRQVRAGLFGSVITIPTASDQRYIIDLDEAYNTRFKLVMDWHVYAQTINRWVSEPSIKTGLMSVVDNNNNI